MFLPDFRAEVVTWVLSEVGLFSTPANPSSETRGQSWGYDQNGCGTEGSHTAC